MTNIYTIDQIREMMAAGDLRYIGLDLGHGNGKVAEVGEDGQIVTRVLPANITASLGEKQRSVSAATGAFLKQGRDDTPAANIVQFGDYVYRVGPGVEQDVDATVDRMDYWGGFKDTPELRAFTYATLYQILNGGAHNLALALPLPIEMVPDAATAKAVEAPIKGWLMGEHRFTINGVETVVNIVNVGAQMSQPMAGFLEWGLDGKGMWNKGEEAMRAPTWVIDLGFNTLDVLAVRAGKISDRSRGDRLGMRLAAETLGERLKNKYQILPNLRLLDIMIRQAGFNQPVKAWVQGQETDVTGIAKDSLSTTMTQIVNFVRQTIGHAGDARIITIGGGALPLGTRLIADYPNATISQEPITAVARGAAKMAHRPGYLVPKA